MHASPLITSPFSLLNKDFIRYLNLIAIALVTASFLYLVASNWFMLPSGLRIAIPLGLLLMVAGVSVLDRWSSTIHQALHTVCGMLIGLSLASIGQIYQTGADSYQLFLVWASLLLPWLLYDFKRANTGLFVLFCVVSQLALGLYFSQTFLLDDYKYLYIIAVNLLTLMQMYPSFKIHSASRFIMIVWLSVISITASVSFNSNYYRDIILAEQLSTFVSIFLLIGISLFYFYRRHKQLETLLSVIGLSLAVMVFLLYWVDMTFDHSLERFVGAIVVFAEFVFVAYLFRKIFTNSTLHTVLLAIGAWIAGLNLLWFFLLALEYKIVLLILGGIFLLGSIALVNTGKVFLRHLGYCLMITGQSAVLSYSVIESHSVYPLVPIQLAIFAMLMIFIKRLHWLILTGQLLVTYGSLLLVSADFFELSLWGSEGKNTEFLISWLVMSYAVYGLLMLFAWKKFNSSYSRGIISTVLVVSMGMMLVMPFLLSDKYDLMYQLDYSFVDMVDYALSAIYFVAFMLIFQRQTAKIIILAMAILAGILTYFGYFEIFLLLMLIAWAVQKQDKLILTLTLLVFSVALWQLYYQLHISFLYKALSIFISGVGVFGLAKVVDNAQQAQHFQLIEQNAIDGGGYDV